MLVNIHFQMDQKWPSQIRDHLLFMPNGEWLAERKGDRPKI